MRAAGIERVRYPYARPQQSCGAVWLRRKEASGKRLGCATMVVMSDPRRSLDFRTLLVQSGKNEAWSPDQ